MNITTAAGHLQETREKIFEIKAILFSPPKSTSSPLKTVEIIDIEGKQDPPTLKTRG